MSEAEPPARREDPDVLTQLTMLNNELATAQRDLAAKNARLARLNDEKNVLLGTVAHDLRNPLTGVAGLLQLLLLGRSGELDDTARRTVERIAGLTDRMVALTDDLVDLAAVESGRVRLQVEEVDVSSLLEESVELVRFHAADKGIPLRVEAPSGLTVRGDRGKLSQVVENLVSNAVKYSHREQAVEVLARREGDEVVVTVADHGQGIPPDEVSGLFQPFGTTSVGATAGERSTGLGLAIVQRLVRAHDGTVAVDSEVGAGSAFRVRLPLAGPDQTGAP